MKLSLLNGSLIISKLKNNIMGQFICCLIGIVIGAVVFIITFPIVTKILDVIFDFIDYIYDLADRFNDFVKSIFKRN